MVAFFLTKKSGAVNVANLRTPSPRQFLWRHAFSENKTIILIHKFKIIDIKIIIGDYPSPTVSTNSGFPKFHMVWGGHSLQILYGGHVPPMASLHHWS